MSQSATVTTTYIAEQVIETVDAPVRHLLAVDGYPPTSAQMKEENDRHQELLNSASRRHAIQKQQDDDDKKMEELLRIIPEAFVFEDRGKEGESEIIAFHPNPEFKPKTYEQRVLHALEWDSLHRSSRQANSTPFWFIGNTSEVWVWSDRPVKQGGTTEITRVQLSPGVWKN